MLSLEGAAALGEKDGPGLQLADLHMLLAAQGIRGVEISDTVLLGDGSCRGLLRYDRIDGKVVFNQEWPHIDYAQQAKGLFSVRRKSESVARQEAIASHLTAATAPHPAAKPCTVWVRDASAEVPVHDPAAHPSVAVQLTFLTPKEVLPFLRTAAAMRFDGFLVKYTAPVRNRHNLLRAIFTPFLTKVEMHECYAGLDDPDASLAARTSTSVSAHARCVDVCGETERAVSHTCNALFDFFKSQDISLQQAVLYMMEVTPGRVHFLWCSQLTLRPWFGAKDTHSPKKQLTSGAEERSKTKSSGGPVANSVQPEQGPRLWVATPPPTPTTHQGATEQYIDMVDEIRHFGFYPNDEEKIKNALKRQIQTIHRVTDFPADPLAALDDTPPYNDDFIAALCDPAKATSFFGLRRSRPVGPLRRGSSAGGAHALRRTLSRAGTISSFRNSMVRSPLLREAVEKLEAHLSQPAAAGGSSGGGAHPLQRRKSTMSGTPTSPIARGASARRFSSSFGPLTDLDATLASLTEVSAQLSPSQASPGASSPGAKRLRHRHVSVVQLPEDNNDEPLCDDSEPTMTTTTNNLHDVTDRLEESVAGHSTTTISDAHLSAAGDNAPGLCLESGLEAAAPDPHHLGHIRRLRRKYASSTLADDEADAMFKRTVIRTLAHRRAAVTMHARVQRAKERSARREASATPAPTHRRDASDGAARPFRGRPEWTGVLHVDYCASRPRSQETALPRRRDRKGATTSTSNASVIPPPMSFEVSRDMSLGGYLLHPTGSCKSANSTPPPAACRFLTQKELDEANCARAAATRFPDAPVVEFSNTHLSISEEILRSQRAKGRRGRHVLDLLFAGDAGSADERKWQRYAVSSSENALGSRAGRVDHSSHADELETRRPGSASGRWSVHDEREQPPSQLHRLQRAQQRHNSVMAAKYGALEARSSTEAVLGAFQDLLYEFKCKEQQQRHLRHQPSAEVVLRIPWHHASLRTELRALLVGVGFRERAAHLEEQQQQQQQRSPEPEPTVETKHGAMDGGEGQHQEQQQAPASTLADLFAAVESGSDGDGDIDPRSHPGHPFFRKEYALPNNIAAISSAEARAEQYVADVAALFANAEWPLLNRIQHMVDHEGFAFFDAVIAVRRSDLKQATVARRRSVNRFEPSIVTTSETSNSPRKEHTWAGSQRGGNVETPSASFSFAASVSFAPDVAFGDL